MMEDRYETLFKEAGTFSDLTGFELFSEPSIKLSLLDHREREALVDGERPADMGDANAGRPDD